SCRHAFKLWEESRQQEGCIGTPSAWHQDVLLPVNRIRDDAATHSGASVEAPQNLPGLGVKGLKLTHRIAVEHQTAGGGEHAGKSRHIHRIAPFLFACEGIISTELTGLAAIGRHNHPAEIVRTSITGAVLL